MQDSQDCYFCGGIHFGSFGCPYKCNVCGKDQRVDANTPCECSIVCGFGCRGTCNGHVQKQKPSSLEHRIASQQAELERLRAYTKLCAGHARDCATGHMPFATCAACLLTKATNMRFKAENRKDELEQELERLRGEIAFWKDAPAAELPRLVVCAVIVRDGRILLEKRAPVGVNGLDGSWDLPGGKVEARERPHQAIEREIYEEMGVRIRCLCLLPEPLPSVWSYAQGKRHWLLVGCVCAIEEGEPTIGENLQWFSGRDLPETLLDADRRLIEDYMAITRTDAALNPPAAESGDGK